MTDFLILFFGIVFAILIVIGINYLITLIIYNSSRQVISFKRTFWITFFFSAFVSVPLAILETVAANVEEIRQSNEMAKEAAKREVEENKANLNDNGVYTLIAKG